MLLGTLGAFQNGILEKIFSMAFFDKWAHSDDFW
jgi:hypothetical protein